MYRLMDGKIYGVLMDYDISAWRTPPTSNGAPTPKSRCGTLLFMSHELLADADEPHLYRHEVESFFYMMLFLTTQNELRAPPGGSIAGCACKNGRGARSCRTMIGSTDHHEVTFLAANLPSFGE